MRIVAFFRDDSRNFAQDVGLFAASRPVSLGFNKDGRVRFRGNGKVCFLGGRGTSDKKTTTHGIANIVKHAGNDRFREVLQLPAPYLAFDRSSAPQLESLD